MSIPPSRTLPGGRIPIIDLVRLLSIMAVIAVHLSGSQLVRLPQSSWLADFTVYFVRNGIYGVMMFFVVSGFVITRTITRRDPDLGRLDLRGFYVRRAGRILPLLLFSILVGVALLHGLDSSPSVNYCLRNPGARFDGWFWLSIGTFSFNWLRLAREATSSGFGLHWDVLWSLAIEEQFYLLYPLMLRGLKSHKKVALALGMLVIVGPLARLDAVLLWPENFYARIFTSFAAFDLLAMGALLAFLVEAWPAPALRLRHAEIALGLLGAAGAVLTYRFSYLAGAFDCLWAPSALGLSLCALLLAGVRRRWCDAWLGRLLSYPGQLSYGGYLLHPLLLLVLWPLLGGRSAPLAFLMLATAVLIFAAGTYRLFEEPMNRWVRRWE